MGQRCWAGESAWLASGRVQLCRVRTDDPPPLYKGKEVGVCVTSGLTLTLVKPLKHIPRLHADKDTVAAVFDALCQMSQTKWQSQVTPCLALGREVLVTGGLRPLCYNPSKPSALCQGKVLVLMGALPDGMLPLPRRS